MQWRERGAGKSPRRGNSRRSVRVCPGLRLRHLASIAFTCFLSIAQADDGYRLWLRYERITDDALRNSYVAAARNISLFLPETTESSTLAAAREELTAGISGLLEIQPQFKRIQNPADPSLGAEGFAIKSTPNGIQILANREIGILYGAFALLRYLQTHQPLARLDVTSVPKIQRRLLNHWDNLNRTVERGQAGQSLWEWFSLPDFVSPRYRDYARANASIGINGSVLTNVNADALVLTTPYLRKVAAIADVFRPYGIRVYLTARFSAPREIGRLPTADPLDAEVAAWWRTKADEIHALIPDFGGFLVKANSEGQPGPQNYGRSHAEGANVIADAVAPHGGIVMWRAFVYASDVPDDRSKQAFTEFQPLDGQFRANVVVQIKNGPIDFMPREPFHPLFGAMPRTPLALEVQIAQEYLGGAVHLAFLAPMWKECLDADTFRPARGATVARVLDGSFVTGNSAVTQPAPTVTSPGQDRSSSTTPKLSVIAGVANIGSDRNWTGHPLAQANWYAFGRLAWDHSSAPTTIAEEWVRMAFSAADAVARPLASMLLESHEAVVDYSMPLGLHHIMAEGHHYGPGPWVSRSSRPDWNSTYYHRADEAGIGFNRTATGSNALAQYTTEVARQWGDPATCPEKFLLWFHHLPWDHRMKSGRILWDELAFHYQRGVTAVRRWQKTWGALEATNAIDRERFDHVRALLARQEREACEWRDACLLYFQTFSKRPLPPGVEPPSRTLDEYKAVQRRYVPGSPDGK